MNVDCENESANSASANGSCEFETESRSTNSASASGSGDSESKGDSKDKDCDEEKGKRNFQLSWLQTYPWLKYDKSSNVMFCTSCRDAKMKNSMANGTDNFRTSTLT